MKDKRIYTSASERLQTLLVVAVEAFQWGVWLDVWGYSWRTDGLTIKTGGFVDSIATGQKDMHRILLFIYNFLASICLSMMPVIDVCGIIGFDR